MWALGSQRKWSAKPFSRFVADLANESNCAVHMGCTQALDCFSCLNGSGLPLLLEQYIPDRSAGRDLMVEELERLGLPARRMCTSPDGFVS